MVVNYNFKYKKSKSTNVTVKNRNVIINMICFKRIVKNQLIIIAGT